MGRVKGVVRAQGGARPARAPQSDELAAAREEIALLKINAETLRDERDALRADLATANAERKRLQTLVPADPAAASGPFDASRPHRIVAPFRGILGFGIMEFRGDHSEIVTDPMVLQKLHDAGAHMVPI